MNETDEDVSVEVDGVSLRKTLNDHQFETLAVVFDIRSGRDGPAGVSVADEIPDGVTAEDIGFHPEYGGEHWQAEGDEVVFSRTFEPGEQYTTVYGVRDFDEPRGALLREPAIDVDRGSADGTVEGIDELVSEEDSDMVREVIAGERDVLPGMGESDGAATADADPVGVGDDLVEAEGATMGDPADWADEEPESAAADGPDPTTAADAAPDADAPDGATTADTADVGEPGDAPPGDTAGTEAPATEETVGDESMGGEETSPADTGADEPDTPGAGEPSDVAAVEEPSDIATDEEPSDVAAETDDEEAAAETDDEVTVPVTGGIARVLAKELRAGNVSLEDRRLLREELLPDEGSTDARIRRLQTQVADLAAYTDALEAFLDEEGGAEAVLEDIEEEVDGLAEDVDAVESSVADVTETVDGVSADLDATDETVADVAEDVASVTGTVERLADDVADLETAVDRIGSLDRRLEGVEDDVSSIQDQLEELATFRDQLSSVFGAGGEMGGGQSGEPGGDDGF